MERQSHARSALKTTAREPRVARWTMTSKKSTGSRNPSRAWTTTRWPEEETGKNSVSPWTIPRVSASQVPIGSYSSKNQR